MDPKIMNALLFFALCFLFSCSSDDKNHAPLAQDSVSVKGADSSSHADSVATTNVRAAADSTKSMAAKLPGTVDKSTEKPKTKKRAQASDSTALAKKKVIAAAPAANSPAANGNLPTPNNSPADKPFVSKYGIIPRNATENNITSFLNAFPDKTTLIKVNYDADPDTEMLGVRAQIVKVLKKLGYNDIVDQPIVLHPMHMPKDIHYELQHDGSVVIWVPVADTGQD